MSTNPQDPRSNQFGFTLIELLIVIALIAILAVTGAVIYLGIMPKARNDRRKADIISIAKALEVNKTFNGYSPLADSQFTTNTIPSLDPQNNSYCGNSTVNTQPASPTSPWIGLSCPTGYSQVSNNIPVSTANGITSWKICGWLEAENTSVAQAFCRNSSQ